MNAEYRHGNRNKFLLRYHLIFVCKYRKSCLANRRVADYIKELSVYISQKHNVSILIMEADRDHIHYMIETTPNMNLSDFVRVLKQYTTYHVWERFGLLLSNYYWHEKTFWTDGYFIASIGEVSSTTIQQYIKNQGK